MKMTTISTWVFSSALIFSFSMSAEARSEYVPTLQTQLGTMNVSCSACHAGTATEGNAVLPIANTFRTGAELGQSDSDGDGFTNKQEVYSGYTFNNAGASPFTLAKNLESSTSTKVVVAGAGMVTETDITDIYAQAGITVPAGSEIVSAVSPTITAVPAKITFSKPVTSNSKVYTVNFANQTHIQITNGISYNTDGSIVVTGIAVPADIVVERVIPIPPAPGSGGYSVGEEEECMTSGGSTMMLMTMAMLTLGLFVRRRKE